MTHSRDPGPSVNGDRRLDLSAAHASNISIESTWHQAGPQTDDLTCAVNIDPGLSNSPESRPMGVGTTGLERRSGGGGKASVPGEVLVEPRQYSAVPVPRVIRGLEAVASAARVRRGAGH